MTFEKRRYIPDLTRQMAVAEVNYHRLQRLLGEFTQLATLQVTLQHGHGAAATQLQVQVIERFSYTTTLEVQLGGGAKWWQKPLHVRLYHDMRMAEVVKSADYRQYRGSYGFVNNQGLVADEKAQLNSYLALLLKQALQHGTHAQRQVEEVAKAR